MKYSRNTFGDAIWFLFANDIYVVKQIYGMYCVHPSLPLKTGDEVVEYAIEKGFSNAETSK